MTCFECGRAEYVRATLLIQGERYGEIFPVSFPGLKCPQCGAETMYDSESDGLTELISDAYRAKHGLLKGAELRGRRAGLDMTQQEFAEYLGVGVASVKRWESGGIQERGMDELVRIKTGLEEARRNLKVLESLRPRAS